MLKKRIITARILIPVFILLLFTLSPAAFCILTGIFTILAAWEWSSLMGIKPSPRALLYPLGIFFLLIVSLALYIPYILYLAIVWWLVATFLIFVYPIASNQWGKGVWIRALMGVFVLMPCWIAINFIRKENGPATLLFLFVLIWGADSAAYFVGKKWGKHKLAPVISPGKTWQGFCGALVITFPIAIIYLDILKAPSKMWLGVIVLSLITVVFSVIGDLFESMLKRKAGVKDSGFLFPGHGGILDRIDSLTAAAPIFVLGAIILGKIYH
jgi:phosphatidate cytidylyltransferase